MTALGIVLTIVFVLLAVALAVLPAVKAVRIIPQARAANVERLGQYRRTLEPGLNFVMPFLERVKPLIDLREQVVSFEDQPVITEDNLVVHIDTVLFFQVTDPRAADYEIVDYAKAIEQLSATMLRSVIGSMDLEQTLTSRDRINTMLRGVLDEASGKWGIRVTRVEIKALDPAPASWTRWKSSIARNGRSVPRSWWRKVRSSRRSWSPKGRRPLSRRSSRRSMKATRTPNCSLTSTCRRYHRSPRARAVRCG